MRAMVLEAPGRALALTTLDDPVPREGEVVVRVSACAVCRTDLHVVDGELPEPKLPLVPGHEIVGQVESIGEGVTGLRAGERVGIPWLAWTCRECPPCRAGRENLCRRALFTGYTRDGGFAERVAADARYVFPIPDGYDDVAATPLLCAGLIGYRAYRFAAQRVGEGAGEGLRLGLYGFGAAAHLTIQVARHQGWEVSAFTRPGDVASQEFARRMGAAWVGDSDHMPPDALDAAIIFAPVGPLVPQALRAVRPGGRVVCGGIHMSDIPAFPYRLLWEERSVCSVANLTRRDGDELLSLAGGIALETHTRPYPLESANEALADLRDGRLVGAAVLVP